MMDQDYGHYSVMAHSGGFDIAAFLGAVVLIGTVVLVIVLAVRWLQMSTTKQRVEAGSGVQTPLHILSERYARGEVTKEVYDTTRKDLLAEIEAPETPKA